MELWIRSQSRQTLIKVEKIFTEDEEIYATTNSEFNERIGIYETSKRALEVLDDIQNKILKGSFAEKRNGLNKLLDIVPNPIYVYEMPKE